jgi:hypothetical protein
MSDFTRDPFDLIRGELLSATTRDARRSRRRERVARVVVVSAAVLVVLGSIAIAATNRADVDHRPTTGSVLDVFHDGAANLPDATVPDGHDATLGDGALDGGAGKVLLDRVIDGVHVRISAVARFGNDGKFQRTKPRVCYTTSTDESGVMSVGSTVCTDAFNPGLKVNFSQGMNLGKGGKSNIRSVTTSGIAASDVTKVELLSVSGATEVPLAGKAFWWRSSKRDQLPLEIRVTRSNGAVDVRPTYVPNTLCSTPEIQEIKAWRSKDAALKRCQAALLASLPADLQQ